MKHHDVLKKKKKKGRQFSVAGQKRREGCQYFARRRNLDFFPIGSTLRKISLVEVNVMAWSSTRLEAEGRIKRML